MNSTNYVFDRFQINTQKRLLLRDGQPVQLTSKAFDLLLALIESDGREITKTELFDRVWPSQMIEDANLTVTMSHVRKALGEKAGEHRFIVTIPGRGYRFVGELQPQEDLIIEQHTISHIIIEKETITDSELAVASDSNATTLQSNAFVKKETDGIGLSKHQTAVSLSHRVALSDSRFKIFIGAFVFLVSLALAFGSYSFLNRKRLEPPFQKIKFTRLTNNGKVAGAAVSPDGKFIAYVLSESEGNSLWVQQVDAANAKQILPPTKADFWGLIFSPDGTYIYYNLFSSDKADVELFRIRLLGGVAQKIPNVIASFITFAPDGKQFAYTQPDSAAGQNYLVIADANGNNRVIATKKHPNTFEPIGHVASWSPDGETIACLVNHFEADASYSSIVGINVKDGTEKTLSVEPWYDVSSLEWMKDGSGLLISASEKVSARNQVWFLSYPEGKARRITNDLGHYNWLSVTASGESFVTVQTNSVNSIFVGEVGKEATDFKEITSEVGPLNPFVWTPNGEIIYRSNKDGVSNLWIIQADGSDPKQLTVNAQVDSRGLCISPDGKYLVFASWRSGKSNLWRVDADGSNLTQLTNDTADTHPRCMPDGQWVVYQRGIHSNPSLWKVPLMGGEPVRLTDFRAKWPAISGDGNRISYFYMTEDKWNIGIVSSEGGPMLQRLGVPATLGECVVHWSSDNQSLFYVNTVGNIGNVWLLPLDGSHVKSITNFKSHLLSDFAWSPDKKRLAVTRDVETRDVVLIQKVVP